MESRVLSLGSDNLRCHNPFHSAWHCLATETPLNTAKKQKPFLDGLLPQDHRTHSRANSTGRAVQWQQDQAPAVGMLADRGVSCMCRDAEMCPTILAAGETLCTDREEQGLQSPRETEVDA